MSLLSLSRVFAAMAAGTVLSALALAQTPAAPAAPAVPAAAAPAAALPTSPPAALAVPEKMEIPANSPCTEDIATFCKGITPGEGAILACLGDKSGQLSHACKTRLETMKKDYLASAADCEPDIQAFCATVPHAGGKIMQCLKKHAKDLSVPCKALAAKLKETALAPHAPPAPKPPETPTPGPNPAAGAPGGAPIPAVPAPVAPTPAVPAKK